MDWKQPPTDPNKKWINKSIEIQIMLACNWSCHACDQFSQLTGVSFIKKGTMTMAQIEYFIQEMKTNNAYIGRIRLVGGEPTLHPKFVEIVQLLHRELVPNHVSKIEVISNGSKLDKVQPVKDLVRVRVSNESDKQKHHTANLLYTPASLGYEGKMCNAPWHCGISLNYWGYFPCSSGAGIARLQDVMHWQRLSLPTCTKPCNAVRETWPDLQSLCNQCYHGLKDEHKIKCGTGKLPGQSELNQPGPAIKPFLDAWLSGKQADWKVYGSE